MRAHRCTVAQLAILEPALSETVGATFALALREATDEAVRRGVPRQAAIDFIIGHLNIELAIAFGIFPEGKFLDGALQAIDKANSVIFRHGWLDRVFAPAAVLKSVKDIARLRLRERFRARRRAGIRALAPRRQPGQHRG
jgi:D-apionate oxidoisomerase